MKFSPQKISEGRELRNVLEVRRLADHRQVRAHFLAIGAPMIRPTRHCLATPANERQSDDDAMIVLPAERRR
jgi:hypothetical protein